VLRTHGKRAVCAPGINKMSEKKLKIFILTHGGCERLLELLSASDAVEVAGVFVEEAREPKRTLKQKIERSVKYDGVFETVRKFSARLFGGGTDGAAELEAVREGQRSLDALAEKLGIPLFHVENYHTDETKDALRRLDADLGILYGTNIIRKSVFEIPKMGSINIHQGLAPLYRGGPTVFWELFNGEKEIGITVHFVAPKVDTGDIIKQETRPLVYDFGKYGLDYESFLKDFRAGLKEPSAQLMANAVEEIAAGTEKRTGQDTSIGKRYRLPTKREKDEMIRVLVERGNR